MKWLIWYYFCYCEFVFNSSLCVSECVSFYSSFISFIFFNIAHLRLIFILLIHSIIVYAYVCLWGEIEIISRYEMGLKCAGYIINITFYHFLINFLFYLRFCKSRVRWFACKKGEKLLLSQLITLVCYELFSMFYIANILML